MKNKSEREIKVTDLWRDKERENTKLLLDQQ